jgi:hypothetical protein
MNAYIRFEAGLDRDSPTIKPYMEDRWADTPDVAATPLEVSLAMLDSLHDRWVRLLLHLQRRLDAHFQPSELGTMPLEKNLALYSGTAAITSRM